MHKAPELPQINWLEQISCGNNQLGMNSSIQAILENRVKVPFTTMATSLLLLNTIQQPTIRQSVLLLAIAQSMNVIVMVRDKICLDIDDRFHDIISII